MDRRNPPSTATEVTPSTAQFAAAIRDAEDWAAAAHEARRRLEALDTLPARYFREGLAEAVKHGVVADAAYFRWLEAAAPALARRERGALGRLVGGSVRIKALARFLIRAR